MSAAFRFDNPVPSRKDFISIHATLHILFMQLFGAGCILVVVLTHICEGLRLFPSMGWGIEHSSGHYVDLAGAVLGVTLFPPGYLLHALSPARCVRPSDE